MATTHIDTRRVFWDATYQAKVLRATGRPLWDINGAEITGGPPPPPPPPPPATSLFAGHIPNQVRIGMSTTDDGTELKPNWTEARSIIGSEIQYLRAHREFNSGNLTTSWVNSTLTWNESRGLYPLLSGKYSNTTWATILSSHQADWNSLREKAKAQRTAGPGGAPLPFAVGFNHEPDGDGSLTDWSVGHIQMSNFFAGWTTNGDGTKGTYTAANDVRDILCWYCCPNGHWWGPKNVKNDRIAAACPPLLVQTFKENSHVIAPDLYDPNPGNDLGATDPARFDGPFTFPTNADRTSKKILAFAEWSDAVDSGPIGCCEISAVDAAGLQDAFDVIFSYRHKWGWASYFNSASGSRWDWRLIPNGYPVQNPDVYKSGVLTLRDFGGKPMHAAKVAVFKQVLSDSVLVQVG